MNQGLPPLNRIREWRTLTMTENGTYRIHDDPPVVTDDREAAHAAKQLGYEVTEVENDG